MKKYMRWLVLSSLLPAFLLQACKKEENTPLQFGVDKIASTMPLEWYDLFLEIDRYAPGYRPPAAARALGYVGLGAYEASVHAMTKHKSIRSRFTGLSLPAKPEGVVYTPAVVNAYYKAIFSSFYPHIKNEHTAKIQQMEEKWENVYDKDLSAEDLARSISYGQAMAKAIYDWSATDTWGHDAYKNPHPTDYTPPVAPGNWQPTAPDFTRALFPHWGKVRSFSLLQSDMVGLPPIPYSENPSSAYYAQHQELYQYTTNPLNTHLWIGEFWSDDIFQQTFEPAARWVAIANQVIIKEQANMETTLTCYAQMGMALADAGIITWDNKYRYMVQRPVSYINKMIDPNWKSLLNNTITGQKAVTPPFPAYPSGHSAFGGAGADVLEAIFGANYRLTDRCHEGRTEFLGMPRSFPSFDAMADENAISRIYLGVHIRMDTEEGLRVGRLAAKRVLDLPWNQ